MPYSVRTRRRFYPVATDARNDISEQQLVEYGAERLRMLCQGAGYGAATSAVIDNFRALLSPWGEVALGHRSGWVSDISDDHTPIEFSVAITNGKPEVRVLFEVQASEPTLAAQRAAGLAFSARLEREFGATLDRFHLVEDLFLPEDMQGTFALWNAVVFSPDRPPEFKAYFNPQARGRQRAHALVEDALVRLGFPRAWAALGITSTRRSPLLDEVKYFSLDLTADSNARVKVYVHHHRATPDDLEIACSLSGSYVPGEARDFARAMRGGGGQRLSARSPFTCASFVSEADERALTTTLYIPVCAYARDDSVVQGRVDDYLASSGVDAAPYDSIVDGFRNRGLDEGVGMQSWVALRRQRNTSRLTIYLGTEANCVYPPGSIPAATTDRMTFASAEEILAVFRGYDLADHPFLRRIMRDGTAEQLWLLVANAYEGTSKHFIQWLATVTARVSDDRMRCLLARQLDQELGEGDFSQAHSVLMQSFLGALERLRPRDFRDFQLDPGRRLGARLARHYLSEDEYEGAAALMTGEICAQQLIRAVAQLLKAQECPFDATTLAWLTLHDELEGNHAEESFALARLVPRSKEAVESVRRGSLGMHSALWSFLDEMYRSCFSTLPTAAASVPQARASGVRRISFGPPSENEGAMGYEHDARNPQRAGRARPSRAKRAAAAR